MYYSIELIRLLSVVLITFTHIRHGFDEGFMYLLLEQIPLYGTLILSVISGFLYAEVTAKKDGLVRKKVWSLLIPYLIANIAVIVPVVAAHFAGFDFLNRLSIGPELFWNGLFSVSAAPVNPPTYFIRDLFIIFMMVEVVRNRNMYLFAGLILLAFYGELLLRYDILILFLAGAGLARFKLLYKQKKVQTLLVCLAGAALMFYLDVPYARHWMAVVFFVLLINWKVGFMDVGGYSYTLHLYHSPVIVVLFPLLAAFIGNAYLLVLGQLAAVFIFVSLIYLIIRRFDLKVAIGGR